MSSRKWSKISYKRVSEEVIALMKVVNVCVFFFSSRRRHTRSLRDWSSDVCSSDLAWVAVEQGREPAADERGAVDQDLVGLVELEHDALAVATVGFGAVASMGVASPRYIRFPAWFR